MDNSKLRDFVGGVWDDEVVPQLVDYIKIPNKSPVFDPKWDEHGYMEEAVVAHCRAVRARQNLPGLQLEVVRLEGRTPLLYLEVPGESENRRPRGRHSALWPSGQAARDDGLARRGSGPGSRYWSVTGSGTRGRGRRLCRLRLARRPAGPQEQSCPMPAASS